MKMSRWVKNLSIKIKTVNILEENGFTFGFDVYILEWRTLKPYFKK